MFPHPTQNQLLASLPPAQWEALRAQLEWLELPLGAVLLEADAAIEYVYFPATAVVSLVSMMKDGSAAEVAVVGREGMVGVSAFMGDGLAGSHAVVHSAGFGLRMKASALNAAARESATLMHTLLRYTQSLFTQMVQTSACTRHHAVDQQLCRWLLINHDRVHGDELVATQERIANLLGVRRESVTSAALKLQTAGLISYRHGRIAILNRAGLERASCECYAVIRQAYNRLAQYACTDEDTVAATAVAGRPKLQSPARASTGWRLAMAA